MSRLIKEHAVIERLSHLTLYVLDQDEALVFYRDKLGFEVRNDMKTPNFRWLTVGPKTRLILRTDAAPFNALAEGPSAPAASPAPGAAPLMPPLPGSPALSQWQFSGTGSH